MALPKKPLNSNPNRLRTFCREYVKDWNATRAAKAAGYAPASAYVAGSRLLRNDKVQEYISKMLDKHGTSAQMRKEEILGELKAIAVSDVRSLINPKTGAVLPPEEWPDDLAKCVTSIEVKEIFNRAGKLTGYIKKIKLSEKIKALELQGKSQKMFTDRVEHGGEINHNIAVVDIEQMKALKREFDSEY